MAIGLKYQITIWRLYNDGRVIENRLDWKKFDAFDQTFPLKCRNMKNINELYYTHSTGRFFDLKEFQHIFHLNAILLNCFDYSGLKMLKACNIRS